MRAIYQLNATALQPGDVILETGTGLFSKLIRLFDRGPYSHVILYLGANFIVEAVGSGVRILQASRIITYDPRRYLVLRHPGLAQKELKSEEMKELVADRLFGTLISDLNRPYSLWGAFRTKLPFLRRAKNEFFCSQLVAQTFEKIGVPAFDATKSSDIVTPNLFLTEACNLKERVDGCFEKLPNFEWLPPLAEDRFKVLESGPLPLLEIGSKLAKETVRIFGPRVDAATRKINKVQTIRSMQDLYLTLYFPDLPNGDKLSDELVEWMKLRYPTKAIREFAAGHRRMISHIAESPDRRLLNTVIKTLQKDIDTMQQLLPRFDTQLASMRSMPPPFKVRSIHRWLEEELGESVAFERDLLNWRIAQVQDLRRALNALEGESELARPPSTATQGDARQPAPPKEKA